MKNFIPNPRLLIQGDANTAAQFVGLAKKLAKQTYAAGIRAKSWAIGKVAVIKVENYLESYLSKAYIYAMPTGYDFLAVVWEPEGIVLTPRTATALYGYGFPKRGVGILGESGNTRYFTGGEKINPPYGTLIENEEDECLNQVLINRFKNNKYLDRIEYITGLPDADDAFDFPLENRRLRATIETEYDQTGYTKVEARSFVVYWQLFYFPSADDGDTTFWTNPNNGFKWYDAPGIDKHNRAYRPVKLADGVPLYRQFAVGNDGLSTVLSEKLLYETENEEWFCHWPEELLYDNNGYEMLFYLTNQYRAAAGLKPLFREIRGHANTAFVALTECQRAKVLFHDNTTLYRQGYKTVTQRSDNAGVLWKSLGENLLISSEAGKYGIDEGEVVAGLWKESPPHYANMISSEWDNHSTSHNIFGGVKGSATSSQYAGELDPPVTGSFWCQIFTKRKYWIMAGNINQTTRYGSVSYFWGSFPLGLPRSIGSSEELYLYFKGREMLIYPIANRIVAGYLVFLLGAAICKIDNVYYVRVVFSAGLTGVPTSSLYIYRRPLLGNHNENWVKEAERVNEAAVNIYSTASFDYDGNKAIINRTLIDSWNSANYYFPLDSNQFKAIAISQSFLEYDNGTFAIVGNQQGPLVSYQVFTEDYTSGPTTYRYITRYLQTCNDEEGVLIHPYYVYNMDHTTTELKYIRVKTSFEIDQTRTGYTSPVYQNNWFIVETAVFPSGKELIIKNVAASSNAEKSLMVIDQDKYIVLFLYIDPVNEDMVYIKINFRGQGAGVYGQASIYADLYDSVEPQLIKAFDEVLLTSNALEHPNLLSSWQIAPDIGLPSAATTCAGIIHPAVSFERDSSGNLYPFFQKITDEWRCAGYTGALRALATKPLNGLFNTRLDFAYGQSTRCTFSTSSKLMNFNYNANIKMCDWVIDGAVGFAARYKDKFVSQIKFDLSKIPKLWNIPYTEENIIWANFDLEDMVNIGPLKNIIPFGVIR